MPRTKPNTKAKLQASTTIPSDMLVLPHLIFVNGILMNPGQNNDYTLQLNKHEESKIIWWNPEVINAFKRGDVHVTVIKLHNGARWGFSNKEGVFLDTRVED